VYCTTLSKAEWPGIAAGPYLYSRTILPSFGQNRFSFRLRPLNWILGRLTPFENAQRWMGKNTFHFLLLNDDNMIGEH
jgi:hypothetical protein